MITLHLRTFAYSPWLFHLFFLIIIHYLLFLFPLPRPLSSRRDSFKRLSFRRTQEENSWVLQTGWGGCHTSERKREDKMKEERGGNKKRNSRSSTPCQQWKTRGFSVIWQCVLMLAACSLLWCQAVCQRRERPVSTYKNGWWGGNHRQSVAYWAFHCKIFSCCVNFHFWITSSPQNAANTSSGSVN